MKKAVILLSGGLDSTVNLYEAKTQSDVVLALTFDYGQRAAPRELERASRIARAAGVEHRALTLPWFSDFTRSSLVDRTRSVPVNADVSIDDFEVSTRSAQSVWVPNRNGILLNIAAGYAEGLGADWIVPGFNAEEAATFADNSQAFLESATQALKYSTRNGVEVMCFTTAMNKSEIVKRGLELNVPFDLIWPCYFDGDAICGQCESCQRFERARRAAV